jgi:PAS domain S-box-containing protein
MPYCILAVTLLLTLAAARKVAQLTQASERMRFDNAVEKMRGQFQRVINGNLILLDGLRGLANAKLAIGKTQFYRYVDALQLREDYPGVQGLGYAQRVPREQAAEVTGKLTKEDPSFHIWPASQRSDSCPIIFLAPSDVRNDAAIGYDLFTERLSFGALAGSAETGRPTASFQVLPAQSNSRDQAEVFLAAPVFWNGIRPDTHEERVKQFMGFVLCSFRLRDLFKALSDAPLNPEIAFRVYDGEKLDSGDLLYDTTLPAARQSKAPQFVATGALSLADRTLTAVFLSQPGFSKGSSPALNPFITLAGTLMSFLLFGIASLRARAQAAAERHAEEQQSNEARFRRLVEQSLVGIYVIQDERFVYGNPKMAEIFKCSQEELTSLPIFDFIAAESRPLVKENMEKRLRGEVESIHYELRGLRRDGKTIDVEAHGGRVEYNGKPAILGCLMDVTERKRAEERVRAQLSRLDLLSHTTRAIAERQDLKSIFQVVIRSLEEHMDVDFSCACLYDPAAEELTVACAGVRSAALAAELEMTEQARIAIDANGLSRCVRGELVYEPDIASNEYPFPQRLARGGLRSMVAAPLLVESKVFGVLIAARRQPESFSSGQCEFLRQLTEHVALAANQAQLYGALQQAYDDLRRTQQAVMQQERLRALGQMASGIAHDINNAISPVALYTESLIEKEPNLSERARNYLVTIQRAIDDVAATVARMQEFYRQREPQMTLTQAPLNRLVQQVLDLTRARWSDMPQQRGAMIDVHTELEPDLPTVTGVESEIRDALTNLIINAVDAMPDGGALTLRTRILEAGTGANGSSGARHVAVEVSDTGIGMDEETRRRCLEPFFTTKGERGTGLGLAMVYGMAQRHAGEIEIESAPGRGSTVRLILPVPTSETAEPVHNTRRSGPVERLRLLVVDDDPLLIASLRDILESDGHAVTSADGGQAGIDAFLAAEQLGDPFAAVITDLGMPRVDGRKVAAAVKAASPSTPLILLTGWGQRLVIEGDIPPHVDYVLGKPPKLRELREALAHCRESPKV